MSIADSGDQIASGSESKTRLDAAFATLGAAREICKSLVTLSATIIGAYVALLAWAFPRTTASVGTTPLDGRTALCLSLPVLDFALAIVTFVFGYFGGGFVRKFAPHTLRDIEAFHSIQLSWIRSGAMFLAIGLLSAFAMLGRFLLNLEHGVASGFEYFAAVLSITATLRVLTRVVQSDLAEFLVHILSWMFPLSAIGFFVAGRWGLAIGATLSVLPFVAFAVAAMALFWLIWKVGSR